MIMSNRGTLYTPHLNDVLIFSVITLHSLLYWFYSLHTGLSPKNPNLKWLLRSSLSESKRSSTLGHSLCSPSLWRTTPRFSSTAETTRSSLAESKPLIGEDSSLMGWFCDFFICLKYGLLFDVLDNFDTSLISGLLCVTYFFSDTVIWFWKTSKKCGLRYRRQGRERKSPSQSTRTDLSPRCSFEEILSSWSWEILFKANDFLSGGSIAPVK